MVLFYSFFPLYTTIRPRIMALICTRPFTNIYGPLSCILYFAHDHSTKIYGLLSFILSFMYEHSTKNQGPHSFISFICTEPFDQNVSSSLIYSLSSGESFDQNLEFSLMYFYLFAYDYSTNIRSHSYSLIYYFLNCANISYAVFMAVLPLYFVRCIHGRTALIFHTLQSQLYEVEASNFCIKIAFD